MICRTCGLTKPQEEFPRNKNYKSGYDTWCKVCKREYEAQFSFAPDPSVTEKKCTSCYLILSTQFFYGHKKNRDGYMSICKMCHKADYDRRNYGITKEELTEICGSDCMICGEPGECIDHVQGTKIVRGFLCHNCNKGIGFLRHDDRIVLAALKYLQSPPVIVDGGRYNGPMQTNEGVSP